MSSFEKAMKRYFGSTNNKDTAQTSDPSANNPHAPADRTAVEHSGQDKEPGAAQPTTSPPITIDIPRLEKDRIVLFSPSNRNAVDEYRNIKRPLLHNAFGKRSTTTDHGNLVMVTSAVKGEGKTTTAINLALSIAKELDRTVLLVDADASQRGVSRMMGIEERQGLTDLLSASVTNPGEVLVKTDIPKLTLLPAGQEHPQFTELLASDNMRHLAEELSTRYPDRLILFDAPPLLVTNEARVLAGLMGQILLVVEAEKTTQPMLKEAISYLDNSKPIGTVLNKSRLGFSKGGYYGYGYPSHQPPT
ncbi:MAG: polysaccharide biosynthesis tyrosine autokinase [Gammaproteobacteria bacterium]|nr:polysaccharide biosynthesis tyrosine autokinase [Gammaproteobacteria bacterium]